MNQSLVSIIVPIYNTAEYIGECIQSILSQSYKNIELILVNDGSTDGSDIVCKKYEHLPNVLYFEQSNSGVVAARKRGVEESHGDWIMFVDSDDFIPNYAIERMISKANGVDIIVASNQSFNLKNEPNIIERNEYFKRMYQRNFSCLISPKLFRKSLFNEETLDIPRNYIWGEDYLIILKIAVANFKPVHVCQSPMYFYRYNPSSTCHTFNYSLDYFIQLTDYADRVVEGKITKEEQQKSAAIMRMQFYRFLLHTLKFNIERKHPYVQDTKKRYIEFGDCKLSDRIILYYPSRIMYMISRIVARFEDISLLLEDLKKVYNLLKKI